MMMGNDQLPIGGSNGGTLVLGDITIVQNHNFGGMNPQMAMMQQQMAIQQQQSNMMMLGMASAFAKQSKLLQLAANGELGKDDTLKLAGASSATKPAIEIAASTSGSVEDVQYEVHDDVKTHEFNILSDDDETPTKTANYTQKHMKKFFNKGILQDDVEYNKIMKVDEDQITFVLFVRTKLSDPTYWRDVFRESYTKQTKSVIKSESIQIMSKENAVFFVFLYNQTSANPSVIVVSKNDNKLKIDDAKNYLVDAGVDFDTVAMIQEPVVDDNAVSNPYNCGFTAYKHDCLFSTGKYLAD